MRGQESEEKASEEQSKAGLVASLVGLVQGSSSEAGSKRKEQKVQENQQ